MNHVFGYDPLLRKMRTFEALPDGRFVVNTEYDAEPIVDAATANRNHLWPGHYRAEHGTKVATIPMPIWIQLKRQGILADQKRFAQWLEEHPAFKAVDGRPLG